MAPLFDAHAKLKLPTTNVAIVDTEGFGLNIRHDDTLPLYCVCILEVGDDGKAKVVKYTDVKRAIDRLQHLLMHGWLVLAHNMRFDYSVLRIRGLQHKIEPGKLSIGCTQVMAHIWDSTKESYSLQALTGQKADVIEAFVNSGLLEERITDAAFWATDWSDNAQAIALIASYCAQDTKATWSLYKRYARLYNSEPKFINALAYIEFPMLAVLSELEVSGAYVDSKLLSDTNQGLTQDKRQLEQQIAAEAGLLPTLKWKDNSYEPYVHEYKDGKSKNKRNLLKHYVDNEGIALTQWSGHLPGEDDGCIVFDYCPLVPYNSSAATGHTWWLLKRYCPDVLKLAESTKKGKPQLNKEYLKDVGDSIPEHLPLAKLAKVNKLLSMVEGISKHIHTDGRIHPSFQNTSTRTTRLSCANPNLQQMPRGGTMVGEVDYGKHIRSLFAASEGNVILVADLDRIEIAVLAFFLAALCKDNSLRDIVNNGESDVHQANADKWGVSRTVAKTLVFLLVYGGQPKLMFKRGLAKSLEEAEAMFASVNEGQPSIAIAKQKVYDRIREKGYISNPFAARGLYPELKGSKWERLRGERQSFNYLIQKTARDIMHMLAIHSLPIVHKYNGTLVNLVHDELAVECPQENAEALKLELNTIWNNRLDIIRDTRVNGDWNIGSNWAEAK